MFMCHILIVLLVYYIVTYHYHHTCTYFMTYLFVFYHSDINECTMFPDICRNGLCQNLQKTGYKCICDQGFEYQGISQTMCVGKYIYPLQRKY